MENIRNYFSNSYMKYNKASNSLYTLQLFNTLFSNNYTFFFGEFQRRPLLMVTFYHQIKIPNNFWCKRGLNSKYLIQSLETLPVELTGTHVIITLLIYYIKKAKPKFTYYLWGSPCLAYYCALGSLNNSSSTIIWL